MPCSLTPPLVKPRHTHPPGRKYCMAAAHVRGSIYSKFVPPLRVNSIGFRSGLRSAVPLQHLNRARSSSLSAITWHLAYIFSLFFILFFRSQADEEGKEVKKIFFCRLPAKQRTIE